MDSIKQAVELARAAELAPGQVARPSSGLAEGPRPGPLDAQIRDVRLNAKHLESSRIVAHGPSSEHGRYYDMLRTQVLQEMDKKSWQFLAVTSPTAACGKTVTACNLAMSMFCTPVLARTASWFFLERCPIQARPNGWPLKPWERFCKLSNENLDRAS